MTKNTLSKITLLLLLIVAASCKSKKLVEVSRPTKDTATVVPNNKAEKLADIRSRQSTFNTFSGKAKTKLDINGNDNDCTLNIRVSRDQKIWVSITAIAGLEVARALITPDSIQVINRFQSIYLSKPFSYIHRFAGRQISFKTLQALLVGNAIDGLLNQDALLTPDGSNTVITGNLQGMVYKLLLGPDMKATQTNLANEAAGQTLEVANRVFIQADNRIVPSQIDIASAVPGNKVLVNLRYTQVEFDRVLEYPFSIPKSYEPAN
ncbi:DUF4292 domain-containing protein [Mucilaginibacter psychrotolerans]|uniref:DUF4292 domain-containing protein n=1 Tax=Mucilaginibacter psychrotolerans TaxID=1524096 RepID=A0A4Y8SHA0_9SPHI|nr:DUF4292 domain-containing protein [Mucilaginibacter psychrotolerans]TFF38308.1 DUF4292 domain-containing protein [Mucilaginibacter psychrotolerans]